jgi:SDR family mycofactocin-dependent oxidoreductase
VTGRLDGVAALVTGAARGLGRSHALRLAAEGADIVAVDICADVSPAPYAMATPDDLAETAELVRRAGRRVVARTADVRHLDQLQAAVDEGVATFGRLDVVVPNAGVVSFGRAWELSEEQWTSAMDILLTGVWHTVKASVPAMISAGRGGAVIIIGSVNSVRPAPGISPYVTAKHGLVGLARSLAAETAIYGIRVNLVAPGTVETDMATSAAILKRYRPDLAEPTLSDVDEFLRARNPMRVRSVEPADVSNAVVFLASDEARYITGAVIPVDAGWLVT